jgi:hypothetical protein
MRFMSDDQKLTDGRRGEVVAEMTDLERYDPLVLSRTEWSG